MSLNLITCVDGIPIICGCDQRSRRVAKPPGNWSTILEQQPEYFCPRCMQMQPGACFRQTNYFTLCCIPICPFKWGEVYLGCGACKKPVDPRSAQQLCATCGTWRGDARFCPSCGTEQDTTYRIPRINRPQQH